MTKLIALLTTLLRGGPLDGYKSILTALFALFLAANSQFGWLDPQTTQTLIALAVALGIWSLKDSQRKLIEN